MAATAALLAPGYAYPREELNGDWQLVCLNQFHDILPGSSTGQVYHDSQEQFRQVMQSAGELRDKAFAAVAGSLSVQDGTTAQEGIWLANPTGFGREDLAFIPGTLAPETLFTRTDSIPVFCQPAEGGVWVSPGPVPAYSLMGLKLESGASQPLPAGGVSAEEGLLENDFLRVELDQAGDICRIFDKVAQRDVLLPGAVADQFQAFEDRPIYWDAWDIDRHYVDKMWLSAPAEQVRVVAAGPLRATLEIRRRILHSEYVQQISLAYNSLRLDFATTIQWQEKHILLKTAFPVDILAPQATYEIQWGNLQRPTHENTSWDWARFETCAHKWVDLSESDYGVSLLNDCKYGHDIHGQVLRLSLLRSPTEPDAHADEGEHHFTYALLPHRGGWNEETIAAAYALNDPWLVAPLNGRPERGEFSLLSVDQPNVVIETVKLAEDGDGVIVRLYESQRSRRKVTLRTGFQLAQAWVCDLLENPQESLPAADNQVQFTLRPFQILTLRLQPGN